MIVNRLFLLLVTILFVVGGTTSALAETKEYSLDVGQLSRTFLVHIPERLTPGRLAPLVIALHGGGGNGKWMEKFSGLSETSEKDGFIVVYPNGSGRLKRAFTWNSGSCCGYAQEYKIDDVTFIRKLIDHMIRQFKADPSRVYITGMSNGAMMAYRLAAEIPGKIAAIAAVAGALNVKPDSVRLPVPILHFHGTDDEFAPFEGGHGLKGLTKMEHVPVMGTIEGWVRINQANPTPTVEELPDRDKDGTHVTRYTYRAKQDFRNIVLYKITGGGHTWPGQSHREPILGRTTSQISANEIMWEFFSAHAR